MKIFVTTRVSVSHHNLLNAEMAVHFNVSSILLFSVLGKFMSQNPATNNQY